MRKATHILRGIGSVVSISPSTDYSSFVPKRSSNELIRDSWEKTGQRIKTAIERFDNDQKEA